MASATNTYSGVKTVWLLPLRLTAFVLIFGITVGWLGFPSYLQAGFFSYSLITLAALLTLVSLKKTRYTFLFRFLMVLHFAAEIINEAGIVYTSGNLYSPFSALFLLTIVSAALVFRLVGTLLIASLVSIAYAMVTWLITALQSRGEWLPNSLTDGLLSASDTIFYSTFLHILIFYLVAFIAGYMADKLRSKDRELQSASVQLRQARLETGDILRHLNSGLATIDRAGHVVYFNRAAEKILDIRECDVAGRDSRVVFSGRLEALGCLFHSALQSEGSLMRTELEIANQKGQKVPIGISTSILYDENFDGRGVIAIFQDLTEAKRMEEKVRQADRMAAVGELSACIAHEIRNPLAAISGSVEVLRNELSLEGDNGRLMSLIIKETARLNTILSDFLLYARVGRPRFHKVELIRLVSDVIEICRQHPAYHKNIKMELLVNQNVAYVSGDEDQIKQVLLNLIVNACEAFENRPGRIGIEILPPESDSGNELLLCVTDNGPGIDAADSGKIFLPFYSTKKGGTGLGLSIVSRLMEALGGRVDIQSVPGQGTTFRLTFRSISKDLSASPDVTVFPISSSG